MRRAVLTLGGTVAGLAALLSYKSHSGAIAAAEGTPANAGTSAATAAPVASRPAVTPTVAASRPAGTKAAASSSAAPAAATRTVTGTVANTQYGPMQVQLTLAGQKITKVTVLQQTDSGSQSSEIDSFAIPKLTSETLAAQSARIDAVSGASYTSSGYIQSLQSALDQVLA
jgi:uncharacterized protein with FMN-binding domain